jgi:putative membrane protein
MLEASPNDADALKALQTQLVYRHIAFVHALRVFLRAASNWPQEGGRELVMASNRYQDALNLLDRQEGKAFCEADNPPNYLLHKQGEDLRGARDRGWMTEYVFVHLDRTLVEFNHIQGRCERIKQTPLPRPYSYFQRMFVHIHGTLMPFAFVQQLHWVMIPLSLIISFVFLTLDLVAARTEDPFENRIGDVPLSALSRNIEITLREQLGESKLPPKPAPVDGVLL